MLNGVNQKLWAVRGLNNVTMIQDHPETWGARKTRQHRYLGAEELETRYVLSKRGQIIDISGDWDRFAWANDGFDATADYVIGRHLSDFLDGFETISFINALVFSCRRLDISFEMISRCDSPTDMNLMRMKIQPDENDTLQISHTLLLSRPFQVPKCGQSAQVHTAGARCSMCCSFKVGRVWVDPLAQPGTQFTASRHGVCPDCKERATDALRRAQTSSPPKLTLV